AGRNDVAQRIEKTTFIVTGAVEPCAARQAGGSDVEDLRGESAHRAPVRSDCSERESRDLVPQFLALLDRPVLHQIPRLVESQVVIEQPDPQGRKRANSA